MLCAHSMVSHYGSWPARPLSHQHPAATHQAVPAAANPTCVRLTLPSQLVISVFFLVLFPLLYTLDTPIGPCPRRRRLHPNSTRSADPRATPTVRAPTYSIPVHPPRQACCTRAWGPSCPSTSCSTTPCASAPSQGTRRMAWMRRHEHLAVSAAGRSALSAGSVRPDRGAAGSALSPVRPGFRPGRRRALWTCTRSRVGAASARGPSLGWPTTAGAPPFPLTAGL